MKNIIILLTVLLWSATSFASDKCPGKEWEFGRAIQVAPTNSSDPRWPKWKAKAGICQNGSVVFGKSQYFQTTKPTPTQLTAKFGEVVRTAVWHSNVEKKRDYYVFAHDHDAEMSRRIGTLTAIILPLLKEKRQIGPGNLAYTPDKPNGTAENETDLTLSDRAWQRMHPVGAMFCQVQVRNNGTAKVKFGQRISQNTVRWFDVRYDIPVDANWYIGQKPFNLSSTFTGYVFKNERYTGDDRDIWTARVLISGYKHPVYTPGKPAPSADGESILQLSEKAWQRVYPDGALFVQIDVRDSGAKVKFLQRVGDQAIVYAVFRDIPVDSGWTVGSTPFNLLKEFPEYNFGNGFRPNSSTEWSARVYLW